MELPTNPGGFQIKPDLDDVQKTEVVKALIAKCINETLLNKTYSAEKVKTWTKTIADDINRGLRDSTRYKHAVQVVIMQKLGQGFKFSARARWDAECDRQITESFTNDTMTCVVTVFCVFLY